MGYWDIPSSQWIRHNQPLFNNIFSDCFKEFSIDNTSTTLFMQLVLISIVPVLPLLAPFLLVVLVLLFPFLHTYVASNKIALSDITSTIHTASRIVLVLFLT
jgi:hypothetical protein